MQKKNLVRERSRKQIGSVVGILYCHSVHVHRERNVHCLLLERIHLLVLVQENAQAETQVVGDARPVYLDPSSKLIREGIVDRPFLQSPEVNRDLGVISLNSA